MDVDIAAGRLAELGHETRLRLFRYLVKSGFKGVPVGTLQEELKIPASTLSHHLSRLTSVGLVKKRREGATLYCIPQYDKLYALIAFLQEECCAEDEGWLLEDEEA